MSRYQLKMMFVGVLVLVAACASTPLGGDDEPVATTSVPTTSVPTTVQPDPTPSETTATAVESSDLDGGVATGSAPDSVIQDVFAAAEDLTGASRVEMTLLKAQAVTWSDGSLGCPEPGFTYIQALVDGYWIQLELGESIIDFRVNDRGSLRLCDRMGLDPGPGNDS